METRRSGPGAPLPGVPPAPATPPRWVAYVDLDAFYVSCEVRDRPELAGRPVIVGVPPAAGPTRGVVLSASYEARAFGVRSALPVAQAARLCPDATWVAPDFDKYEAVSGRVRDLLRTYSDEVVPFSIDEAAVGLSVPDARAAQEVARRIRQSLADDLGLPASIGVATTRLVAKMASEIAKPGGLVVVGPGEVAAFVAPLPVRAVPGVGPKTEALLHAVGVTTIGELSTRRVSELSKQVGGFAKELVALARGEPIESAEVASGPRFRQADRTFPRDVDAWPEVERTVRELATELGTALERDGLVYTGVGVGLRWSDFSRSQHSHALPAAQDGPASLVAWSLRLARELFGAEPAGRRRPVRTVSVRAERLTERSGRQASLDDYASRRGR